MNDAFAFLPAGLALAFALGLVTNALAAWLGRGGESPLSPKWGATLGLGLGYILAHAVIREWFTAARLADARAGFATWRAEGGPFPFFPLDVTDWPAWLAGAALVVGLLDGWRPAPFWAKWENRLLLTALTLWLLLAPLFGGAWETAGQGARWCLGLGLGMLAFWSVLDARAERLGASMPLVMILMAGAAAICLGLSRAIYLAVLSGSLATALGAIWLVSWANRRMNLSRGAISVFVVVFVALILIGHFYNEMNRASTLALMLSPLATFVDRLGPLSRRSPRTLSAIRITALLLPLAIAVGAAFAMRPAEVPVG